MILSGQVSSPERGGETVTLTINLDGYTSPQYAYIRYIDPITMKIVGDENTLPQQYIFPLTITVLKNNMVYFMASGSWGGVPAIRRPYDNNLDVLGVSNQFCLNLSDSASITIYNND